MEQLAKLLPQHSKQSDTDEELDYHFSGMISCLSAVCASTEWIVDSGASDYMTPHFSVLMNTQQLPGNQHINLPNGEKIVVAKKGQMFLAPSLTLDNVLCVPSFKHNLLSVQRLLTNNNCEVVFHPTYCTITDKVTKCVHAVGIARNGLYYVDIAAPKPQFCMSTLLN